MPSRSNAAGIPGGRASDWTQSGQDVFEILMREHADMLSAYLRTALTSPVDIDDVFQETMIVAWKRLAEFDRTRPFGPWLRGIARNHVLAHFRKRTSMPSWCTPEVLDAVDRRFERLSEKSGDTFRDRADALLDCIRKLSERLRQVIELGYGRSMSFRQIANAIETPEDTVRKRAERARLQLHDCLMQNEGSR